MQLRWSLGFPGRLKGLKLERQSLLRAVERVKGQRTFRTFRFFFFFWKNTYASLGPGPQLAKQHVGSVWKGNFGPEVPGIHGGGEAWGDLLMSLGHVWISSSV